MTTNKQGIKTLETTENSERKVMNTTRTRHQEQQYEESNKTTNKQEEHGKENNTNKYQEKDNTNNQRMNQNIQEDEPLEQENNNTDKKKEDANEEAEQDNNHESNNKSTTRGKTQEQAIDEHGEAIPQNTEHKRKSEEEKECDKKEAKSRSVTRWKQIFDQARSVTKTVTATIQERKKYHTQQVITEHKDNIPYGDTCKTKKDTFCIYFQNVNGLAIGNTTRKLDNILQEMTTREVAVFGLAETNVEWSNRHLTARTKAKLRRHFKHASMSTSTSSIKFETYYKPGRTATIAAQQWAGRVTDTVTDNTGKGRWSGVQMANKRTTIMIITGYRVPQSSIAQVGDTIMYAQQWIISRTLGETNPAPRAQFIKDLTRQMRQWQANGNEIILMLDANEQMGTEEEGIQYLTTSCNLTDIHAHRCPNISNMATYSRGSKRIDFILISKNLVDTVTGAGFLPFFQGIESDHRGAFVNFDEKQLFHGKTPLLYTHAARRLTSKLRRAVKTYKAELWKRLQAHNITNRSINIAEEAKLKPQNTE
jgi:hypothetical protein